jgi:S1-C subfamily serine protease
VIGVNTAIIQDAQGIGFAIPINTVQRISQQLVAKGTVQHPYLGLQMVTLTPQVKQRINEAANGDLKVNDNNGILVARVTPDSPAERSGLKVGDVIQSVDGQTVKDADALQQIVESSQVGNTLRMGLSRNGKALNLDVRAGNFPIQKNLES